MSLIVRNLPHIQTAIAVGKTGVLVVQYGIWAWQTYKRYYPVVRTVIHTVDELDYVMVNIAPQD
jgi:hypothetical protein